MIKTFKSSLAGNVLPRPPLTHFLTLIAYNCILVFYAAVSWIQSSRVFSSYMNALLAFVVSFFILLALSLVIAAGFGLKNNSLQSLKLSSLTLSPIIILLFLIPYRFLPVQNNDPQPLFPLILVFLCIALFISVLNDVKPVAFSLKTSYQLTLIIIVYTTLFGALSIAQLNQYQHFNPPDAGLYNQILWNNLHGRFFETSTSGSNFATHNSPFLILLTPLYAIYPHPETLLVLRTIFLAVSAIPFFLIITNILGKDMAVFLAAGYLLYPFLVAQNFSAPHEICFLPPILLSCYYFFAIKKYGVFIIFLILFLSIKEHLSLVAVAFGLLATIQKRDWRWSIVPIGLGIAWAIFSLWLINHFQQIYHYDPSPAWLIENLRARFLANQGNSGIINLAALKTSNIGSWSNFVFVYQLVSPLCIFLPFLSALSLLAAPELTLNLLSDRLIFVPIWHYNIVVSCFLLIATAVGIKKLSNKRLAETLGISTQKLTALLSWFVIFSLMAHSFLWSDFARVRPNSTYVNIVNTAIKTIPAQASVTVPKNLAVYVSSRKDYFLWGDRRLGEYLLTDQNGAENYYRLDEKIKNQYQKIFDKDGVAVFRRFAP